MVNKTSKFLITLFISIFIFLILGSCGDSTNSDNDINKPKVSTEVSQFISDMNDIYNSEEYANYILDNISTSSDNLLKNIIVTDNYINVFFDEILFEASNGFDSTIDAIYTTTYDLVEKYGLGPVAVEVYIGEKSLSTIRTEQMDKFLQTNEGLILARNMQKYIENRPLKPLSADKIVVVNGGHGYTHHNWINKPKIWDYQRSPTPSGYIEDLNNAELAMVLTPMLRRNRNLDVYSVRELNKNAGNGVSGKPKWQENARRHIEEVITKETNGNVDGLEWIWTTGEENKTPTPHSANENKDITSRGYYARYRQADLLIGLHSDAANEPTVTGTRVYISPESCHYIGTKLHNESKEFAQIIINHLKRELSKDYPNWKVGSKPYVKCHGESSLGKVPTAIVELGFHTNPSDVSHLKDNKFRQVAMNAIKLAVLEYLNVEDTPATPHLDGVGSIIRPNGNCWGCNKDNAIMQKHDTASTVVFQWRHSSKDKRCDYLKIGIGGGTWGEKVSDKPLPVVVNVKNWKSHTSDDAYKASLPISVQPKGEWTTIAITSQEKIDYSKRIIATCSDQGINTAKQAINSKDVELADGYWIGNGSLISGHKERDGHNVGTRQDWVKTSSNHPSLTVFQWQPSTECKTITIDTVNTSGSNGSKTNIEDIEVRDWLVNKSRFQHSYNDQCTSLPCTISVPPRNIYDPGDDNIYYILRIKTTANAVKSGYIHASCVR